VYTNTSVNIIGGSVIPKRCTINDLNAVNEIRTYNTDEETDCNACFSD